MFPVFPVLVKKATTGAREYRRGSRSNPMTERKCGMVVVMVGEVIGLLPSLPPNEVGLTLYDGVGRTTFER